MKIAITGHRPNKLGNDYDLTSPLLLSIKHKINEIVAEYWYYPNELEALISGMALGIDTLFAKIAMENHIPLIAAIPCLGQSSVWPDKSRIVYQHLLEYAKEKIVISDKYTATCMQERNIWMVDNCDLLIAVWDGSSGGTANCVKYAQSVNREIIIINPKTIELC